MKAKPLFHNRVDYEDGAIMEMKIWQVPAPVHPSAHDYKYSLYYGRDGERLVGYDNERGKGDHRHFGGRETKYAFTTVERLAADFLADVRKVRGEK